MLGRDVSLLYAIHWLDSGVSLSCTTSIFISRCLPGRRSGRAVLDGGASLLYAIHWLDRGVPFELYGVLLHQ